MRIFKKIFLILMLVLVAGVATYSYSIFYRLPNNPGYSKTKIVMIPKGASVHEVAHKLARKNILPSAFKFKLLAKILGKENLLQWGEYELHYDENPIDILNKLTSGEVVKYKIVIPEGSTVAQVDDTLAKAGLLDDDAFITYALTTEVTDKFGIPGPTLEGYLFPTTYFFPKGLEPSDIAGEMVAHYKNAFSTAIMQNGQQLGFSEKEIVTLASIIEKETGVSEERGKISSVFHNRLQKGMRLQSDPTVIYGIDDFDGNLTKKHLLTYTPYNTYRIKGLPPGPIANPGEQSLLAAVQPEKTDLLYFVANKNGAHVFSQTYAEHKKNVQKYQLARKKN